MSSYFYLPRSLSSDEKTYTEASLLDASNYIVVLAEPGGGKTELMKSLARQLDTSELTANVFLYRGISEEKCPLVIDAFDELAKVDQAGVNKLLADAAKVKPTRVIISSRSSEWGSSATKAFEDFLGHSPLVVRLFEFNEEEQRAIFDYHLPGENFLSFQAEVTRFNLEPLLPNPQFLKLFADAFIESDRHFTDKRSIFDQAVTHLAKEANPDVTRTSPMLSIDQKVNLTSEVFAKLLLSGAEGISTSEASDNRMYPLLESLFVRDKAASAILATRLVKPGDTANQHRWVHKIVAEYCAADYLTKRIADSSDPLTIPKCLPIIAPNLVVRDELRGMLGWMATLGNQSIQASIIKLDPYATLANGDPSQLVHSSKCLLIKQLKTIEDIDPHFRRGDFWRRFSVVGFFNKDVVDEIKPLISKTDGGQLRDLLLELLDGAPSATELLKDELRQLVLASDESDHSRLMANRCLLNVTVDGYFSDLATLITEASNISLQIVAETINARGDERFDRSFLAEFLRTCAILYPSNIELHYQSIGSRYFIKRFIDQLEMSTTEWLLDELTQKLTCTCGKRSYECDCRVGISKIIGLMLDHYFESVIPPFDPIRVWQWVENLNFHQQKPGKESKAVQVIQEDRTLRHGILTHVFSTLTDREKIFDVKHNKFDWHSHSGLGLYREDIKFLVDLAFDIDNLSLWASFLTSHQRNQNNEERGVDTLRQRMRKQALEKSSFMRVWAKFNSNVEQEFARERHLWLVKRTRKMGRRRKQQEVIRTQNIEYVQKHREVVEGGRHWNCLVRFADLVLFYPDRIEDEFGDETLVRNALRNCFDFIYPFVPDLLKLAELKSASCRCHSIRILYAACIEIMRVEGNLEGVNSHLLKALRTDLGGYSAVTTEESKVLSAELDRLLFTDVSSAESFLRKYLEPQLANPDCVHSELWLLSNDEAFCDLRPTLSIEWLRSFPRLHFNSLNKLFEIAAEYGNRDDLKEIILKSCVEFICYCPASTGSDYIEERRNFWYVRAWYFLINPPKACWDWLKNDSDTVLEFYDRSGRLSHGETHYWPNLRSVQVEAILDAFFDKWPKVDLPNHYGTGSPKGETAYRFLTEVIWSISQDDPEDAIPVLHRLLADSRFSDLYNSLKSIHAEQVKKKALNGFEPPTPQQIVSWLDQGAIVTVEGLRQLVIQELIEYQKVINGGEFNTVARFYQKDERLDEEKCRDIIAERLLLRLEQQDISITKEHELKDEKRSDFTVTKMIGGKRRLLVTEVKGQWHKELYTAASAQLHERYSIHPDADQQGIYLVIWFGKNEMVANRKKHEIDNAQYLKGNIEASLPSELKGLIDIFVLDVSRPQDSNY